MKKRGRDSAEKARRSEPEAEKVTEYGKPLKTRWRPLLASPRAFWKEGRPRQNRLFCLPAVFEEFSGFSYGGKKRTRAGNFEPPGGAAAGLIAALMAENGDGIEILY